MITRIIYTRLLNVKGKRAAHSDPHIIHIIDPIIKNAKITKNIK